MIEKACVSVENWVSAQNMSFEEFSMIIASTGIFLFIGGKSMNSENGLSPTLIFILSLVRALMLTIALTV